MIRLTVALGLAFYVAIAAGSAGSFKGSACSQRCADDDSDGNCAPGCSDCTCCPHLRVMTVPSGMKPPLPVGLSEVPGRLVAVPPSPEPGEILHVPIASLA